MFKIDMILKTGFDCLYIEKILFHENYKKGNLFCYDMVIDCSLG